MADLELEHLLEENYDDLVSEECKAKVMEYLKNNASIAHEDIIFIKKFTKVAKHILNSDFGSLEGLLERLYHYHEEGIMKIQQGRIIGINTADITTMRSHLHGHAADIALKIINSYFHKEDAPFKVKMDWGITAYNNGSLAIHFSKNNPLHMCVRHDYLGKISKRVYDLLCTQDSPEEILVEDKIMWLERYHLHKKISAEMSPKDDTANDARRYDQSADGAKLIFLLMDRHGQFSPEDKMHWVKISLDNTLMSAAITAAENPVFSSYKRRDAAEACATLYNLTKDAGYLHECHRMYDQAAKMTINSMPGFSASMEKYAGDTAIIIYSAGMDRLKKDAEKGIKIPASARKRCNRWKRAAERHYKRYLRIYISTDEVLDETRAHSRWKTNVDRVKGSIKKINSDGSGNICLPAFCSGPLQNLENL